MTRLRELAAGRADLLAEVTGTLEGFAEGELHEPHAGKAAQLCRDAGVDPDQACLDRERAAAGSLCPAAVVPGRPAPRVRGACGYMTCGQNASVRGTLSSIGIFAASAIRSLRSWPVMGVPASAR